MFKSTRTNPGLAGLVAVALVIAGYLAGAGFVVKTYVDASTELPAVAAPTEQCHVVCAPVEPASDTNG